MTISAGKLLAIRPIVDAIARGKNFIHKEGDGKPQRTRHGHYEFDRYLIVPKEGNQCMVAVLEVPPGKAAFPYHYHVTITEVFYVISGEGRLVTPAGESSVSTGDVIVFPPGEKGAHQLWNASETELLRYLDVDTTSASDVAFYPNSGKVGLLLDDRPHTFYRVADNVDYYEGE